ncbi:MAG: DUF481 domain-containing protein [Myxococcales bacterium]|nr:DUF481 domain-containing protein [Myxococcales bacterium]
MTPLSLLLASVAVAQVNNENMASAVKDEGYGLQLGGGGSFASGNLSSVSINGSLSVQYRRNFPAEEEEEELPWVKSRALLSASGSLLTFDGLTVIDRRLANLGYTRMLSRRMGLEAAAQYQNNLLLLLDARLTGAVAIRFLFVHRPRLTVSAGLGAMLEHEIRNVDPEGPDARRVTNPRAVGRVSWRVGIIPDGLTWMHTVYAEPRMDRWSDQLIVDYNTLEAHVNKTFSMTADLQLRHDSLPPADLARLDVRLTWGLRFRWAVRPEADQPHH